MTHLYVWAYECFTTRRMSMHGFFHVLGGLDQGDPHSLICYLFYNADLADICNPKKKEHTVIWVDDNTLLVTGATFNVTHDMLRDIWSREGGVAEWARNHNCNFGMPKTQLCDLTRRRVKHAFMLKKRVRMPRAPLVLVEGVTVVPESVVNVLGLLIDDELRWKEQAAVAVAKGQDWLIQFGRLAKMGTGVSMVNMRRLWLAVAIPRIMYGADVWMTPYRHNPGAVLKRDGRAVVGKLTSIQRRATIMMTGALSSTSGDLLNVHADLQPIEILIDRKLHNEALRLATLDTNHPLYAIVKNAAIRHVKR